MECSIASRDRSRMKHCLKKTINKIQVTKDYNIIKNELFMTFGRRSILEFHQWY